MKRKCLGCLIAVCSISQVCWGFVLPNPSSPLPLQHKKTSIGKHCIRVLTFRLAKRKKDKDTIDDWYGADVLKSGNGNGSKRAGLAEQRSESARQQMKALEEEFAKAMVPPERNTYNKNTDIAYQPQDEYDIGSSSSNGIASESVENSLKLMEVSAQVLKNDVDLPTADINGIANVDSDVALDVEELNRASAAISGSGNVLEEEDEEDSEDDEEEDSEMLKVLDMLQEWEYNEDYDYDQDESDLMDISGLSLTSETLQGMLTRGETIDKTPISLTYSVKILSALSTRLKCILTGNLQNFGVEVGVNFDDFVPDAPDMNWSLEEICAYKARKVYEAYGIPCVAEASSFEVAPTNGGVGRQNARYRFNRIGPEVDRLVKYLQPASDPSRKCLFRSVLCYYDGESEVFEYGECITDLNCAASNKVLITATTAIMKICEDLSHFYDLELYMPQSMRSPVEIDSETDTKNMFSGASMLRDCLSKQGRVLPNNIIDVSAFMESYVDTVLLEECAKELVHRCLNLRPTKILTVATTGLVIAVPMAMLLQVPVVYARKERTMVMSDYHSVRYSSKTQNKPVELIVAKVHISKGDRVLIIDDFLSAGSCQDALLRLVSESGGEYVGVGVLVEKAYQKGRTYLSGYNIPIYSLASVTSVAEGIIKLASDGE